MKKSGRAGGGRPGSSAKKGKKSTSSSRGSGRSTGKRTSSSSRSSSPRFKKDGESAPRGRSTSFNSTSRDDRSSDRPSRSYDTDRPKRSFSSEGDDRPKRPYNREGGGDDRPKRPYNREGSGDDRPKRPYNREGGSDRPTRPYNREGSGDDRPKRPYNREGGGDDRPKRPYNREGGGDDRPKRPYNREGGGDDRPKRAYNRDGDKPAFNREGSEDRPMRSYTGDEDKPEVNREGGGDDRPKRPYNREGDGDDRPKRPYNREGSRDERPARPYNRESDDRPTRDYNREGSEDRPKRAYSRDGENNTEGGAPAERGERSRSFTERRSTYKGRKTEGEGSFAPKKWNRKETHEFYGDKKKSSSSRSRAVDDGSTRLNKYIANAGICSRREADDMISAGVISVNGKVVTEMGYKVQRGDEVKYNKSTLKSESMVYVLLNKPKDFITTTDDPEDRKTVMGLISKACKERIYPVGRLDRNTTGVLLFTNDGDLARKLTHPSFQVQKIYQVELDRSLKSTDLKEISDGLKLEDGAIKVDDIVYAGAGEEKNVIGVELHSGKNRIVRRIFESLTYEVKKLDRVVFAGLTKKDLPRGRWRFLTELEVASLKMMTSKSK